MSELAPGFAPAAVLLAHLRELLAGAGVAGADRLDIVRRTPLVYASTSPSEVLACTLPGGEGIQLLCKYAAPGFSGDHGHRGGVAYEAEVYRRVLAPVAVPAARSFGVHRGPRGEAEWLVLEYLDGAARCEQEHDFRRALALAASWAGRFHHLTQDRVAAGDLALLRRYDAAYYSGWAQRTNAFAGELHRRFPWIETLCRRFADFAAVLLEADETAVHGEFYPHNLLLREGTVYPVDWESAAVAAGEIDLACLTERWDERTIAGCREAYVAARWPDGAATGFERRFAAARVYVLLRWLGDRPEWIGGELSLDRFERLGREGRQWGLL